MTARSAVDRVGDRYAGLLAGLMGLAAARPRITVAVMLLLTVLAGVTTARSLDIDTSTAGLISDEVDYRQTQIAFREAFPIFNHLLLIVVDAATPEGADAAADRLAAGLAAEPDLFATVYHPAGDGFFRTNGLLFLSTDELADLADRIAGAQALMAALAGDPSLRGLFGVLAEALDAIADGHSVPGDLRTMFAAIAETIDRALAGEPGAMSWRRLVAGETLGDDARRIIVTQPAHGASDGDLLRAAQALIADLDITPFAPPTVRLTGPVALEQAELATVTQGTELAAALSFALVTLLLVWGLRSGRLIVAVLVPLVAGLVLTFGFATLTVGKLNLISMAFAVLFVGLAVDFGIHVALRFREARAGGGPVAAALDDTARGIGRALSLSAVCAAIGFLAFWPTDYRGLAELGVIAAGGMGVALLVNLTLTPALLAWLAPAGRPARAEGESGLLSRLVDRRPAAILIGAGLAALGAAALAPQARFDLNPLNLQDPAVAPVRTFLDLAADDRTTPYIANVLAPDLAAAVRLSDAAADLAGVGRAITLGDFVPADQAAKLAILDEIGLFVTPVFFALPEPPPTLGDVEAARTDLARALAAADPAVAGPEGAALAAALTRLGEAAAADPAVWATLGGRLLAGFEGYLDDLDQAMQAQPFGLDDLPDSVRSRWVASDGRVRVEIAPAAMIADADGMRRFAEAVRSVAPDATGAPVVLTAGSDVVVRAFLIATAISLSLITLMMALLLRRVDDVMLTLLPLLLAAMLTLATAAAAGLAFNFANVIVLPLLFGLGVSSAIHMVMRRRRDGITAADLLATSTPRAVLFSVLTTAASFGSLAVSPHRGMSSMGVLLTVAIAYTLVTTIVVLPALMRWLDRRRQERAA